MEKSVQKQVVLPWGQVLKIAFNSMKVRFGRSLITTLTLALAIAFVSFTWSNYGILNAVWPHADAECKHTIVSSGYETHQGQFGSTAKDRWLAVLSLLVCVVGIVNAQLMAVTERFREIGTFKCLGALNSFVVRIFVLEAVYQGLMGGVAGAIAGILISTLSLTVKVGFVTLRHWPPGSLLVILIQTSLLAVLLSLLGAFYPTYVAAKMQPAVALRAEE